MRVGVFTRALLRDPLAIVLVAGAVLHGIGLGWGLPSSIGWDDDGVAPRDFLAGVIQSYQSGSFYTYPPLHLLLLTILTTPAWVIGLGRAASLHQVDVIAEFIKSSYMTVFSIVARSVSLAMSVGITYLSFVLARDLWGRRAGICAALVVTLNIVFGYYAHTSNLDVPYLFWAMLALVALERAIAQRAPRRLRAFGIFAAFAICTKDQAYALFLLSCPGLLLLWLATDQEARARWRELAREVVVAACICLSLVLLIDGAIVNPTGFQARIHFLLGPASQGHAVYPANASGYFAITVDCLRFFDRYYPWPVALLSAAGIVWSLFGSIGPMERATRLVPLAATVSFTIAFNWTARRTEARFLLPQMVLLGIYAGYALERLLFQHRLENLARALAVPLLAWALYRAAAVDAALIGDPRYDAERWMEREMVPAARVETYGNDAYLPRFPRSVAVTRVGPEPLGGRSQVPGITEIQGRYADVEQRGSQFVVFSEGWAWRYLTTGGPLRQFGTALSPEQAARELDTRTLAYFQAMVSGESRCKVAHVSRRLSRFWPQVDIHSSTDKPIWILSCPL